MEFNLKWNKNWNGNCLTRMELEREVGIILEWKLLQFKN